MTKLWYMCYGECPKSGECWQSPVNVNKRQQLWWLYEEFYLKVNFRSFTGECRQSQSDNSECWYIETEEDLEELLHSQAMETEPGLAAADEEASDSQVDDQVALQEQQGAITRKRKAAAENLEVQAAKMLKTSHNNFPPRSCWRYRTN